MALPSPNLDDRRFQQLVDEAKRFVQQRSPEWTDHNVSDPGVTLIETFAYMVDQLLYRLNRVPDKHHLAFLDLLGVRLFPPTAATVPVTFWLSAPRPEPVRVPVGTEVATSRAAGSEPVGFATVEELVVVPCRAAEVRAVRAGEPLDRGDLAARVLHGERQAGQDALAVRQHRARPAGALVTALVGAAQPKGLAQQVEQGCAGVDGGFDLGAVHPHRDVLHLWLAFLDRTGIT